MCQIITNVTVTDAKDFGDSAVIFFPKQKLLLQQLKDNVILKMLHKSYLTKQPLYQTF